MGIASLPNTFPENNLAVGAEVYANDVALRNVINGNIDGDNINLATNFAWTGRHSWTNGATTQTILSAIGNSLTTGSLVSLYSNSSDASARSLVTITNDHVDADSTDLVKLVQDADGKFITMLDGATEKISIKKDQLNFISANTGAVSINFGDTDNATIGAIQYSHTEEAIKLIAGGVDLIQLNYNGGDEKLGFGQAGADSLEDDFMFFKNKNGIIEMRLKNADAGASAGADFLVNVPSTGGDPRYVLGITGITGWEMAIDNSDSDSFKIRQYNTANDDFVIDTSGYASFRRFITVPVTDPPIDNDAVDGGGMAKAYLYYNDPAGAIRKNRNIDTFTDEAAAGLYTITFDTAFTFATGKEQVMIFTMLNSGYLEENAGTSELAGNAIDVITYTGGSVATDLSFHMAWFGDLNA